ncbi:hypothetical protein SNE40_010123 [Patella caerulea]|uniref:SH3 domain-binding protein 5-like n=1 Tax=Patella caerulea TaxID=87958 RepID=A0AAN8PZI6_PATCE
MADVLQQVHQGRRRRISSNSSLNAEEYEDEALDPRIQVELEKLNKASDDINKLELELDDARASFRQVLSDSIQKLNVLAKKLGNCVDKARPYYEARHRAKEVHMETHKAALRYERACSMHEAAKEMVQLAEQGYQRREDDSDPAWQEMLNHATMKVNEAELERMESEAEHQRTMMVFKEGEARVQQLQRELKRAITKSNLTTRRSFLQLSNIANRHWLEIIPYFEMKARFNQIMEDQKGRVSRLEEDVTSSKSLYSQALHSLEAISDDIHRQRLEKQTQIRLGVRGAGVGAESPSPPPQGGQIRMDGSVTPHTSSCYDMTEYSLTNQALSKVSPNSPSHSMSDTCISVKNFKPPSIIHSSRDEARRASYRCAIENKQNSIQSPTSGESIRSADYEEDFDVPCLEEEYMALPPRRKSSTQISTQVQKKAVLAESEEEIFPWNENKKMQSKPIDIKQEPCLSSSPGSPSYLVQRHLTSSHSTPDDSSVTSSSPSTPKQKSKLQGLILRVNPIMEPLSQVYPQTRQKDATQQYSHHQEALAPDNPHLVQTRAHRTSSLPLERTSFKDADSENLVQVSKPGKKLHTPDSKELNTQIDRLNSLRLPESVDSGDDNSDTESIASTGPMLDDDQVEYLTLDFSEQAKLPSPSCTPALQRQSWSRISLPPRLNYLEPYIEKSRTDLPKKTANTDVADSSAEESNI